MKCPKCQNKSLLPIKVCSKCGFDNEHKFICPNCSAEVTKGMTYCIDCQTVFTDEQLRRIVQTSSSSDKNKVFWLDEKFFGWQKDFLITVAILFLQFVLAIVIAPFLRVNPVSEGLFHYIGTSSAYVFIIGLAITWVRNAKSYNKGILFFIALVLYTSAIFENIKVGTPAISALCIIYYQIWNNNRKIADGISSIASGIIAGLIVAVGLISQVPNLEVFQKNQGQDKSDEKIQNVQSVRPSCPTLTHEDTLFVQATIRDLWQAGGAVTKERHDRFARLIKECPSGMKKPDLSENIALSLRYYEDMIKTIKQNKLVISQERIKLGKPTFDEQNRNLEKVLNGELIVERGTSYLVDLKTAEAALEAEKEIVAMVKAKFDSLYDTSLVIQEPVLKTDSASRYDDSLFESILADLKNQPNCKMTSNDSQFVSDVFDGLWEATLPITKDMHKRFHKLYDDCYWTLRKPDWNGTVTRKILYYDDLASSMSQKRLVTSLERQQLDEEYIEQQNEMIFDFLKDDTIRPQNGEPFILDSENVVYNKNVFEKKAIVALAKLDSLYDDSLYTRK